MKVHQLYRTPSPAPGSFGLCQILQLLLAGFVCALLASCTSAGYQKGDTAAMSMQKAAMEVQAETRVMNETATHLRDMVNEPNGDLSVPFKRYSKSLDQLVAAAKRTENTGKSMEQKSAAYLQAWDQQLQTIDYQHIRDLSEARRSEVTNRVEAINRRYRESQTAIQPLIAYFEDIRKALSADLTVDGLNSLKGVTQNAQANVTKVQTALDSLSAELTNSSTLLSSVAYHEQHNPRAVSQP